MSDIWRKKRILLVGGAGTLGSDILASPLPDFVFFVIDDFKNATLSEVELSKICDYRKNNVADSQAIKEVFLNFRPDVVIYLATSLSNDENRAVESNILGVKNVITEASLNNYPHLIYIQSFLTRETFEPINEKSGKVARNSYATWKLSGELLLSTYQGKKTTIILSSILSPLISIGAIPAFVKNIVHNRPSIINKTYRDYLNPQSFIDALKIIIVEDFNLSEIVIGSGIEISSEELFRQVASGLSINSKNLNFEIVNPKPTDPERILLSSTLFQELTGWQPTLSLEHQVKKILENLKFRRDFEVRLHH
jgi:nucleoside-diphosphate-sugar epimerase